jgi:hypothetical protein
MLRSHFRLSLSLALALSLSLSPHLRGIILVSKQDDTL